MEGAYVEKKMGNKKLRNKDKMNLETLSPELMMKKIKILEKEMYQHARDLEFEEAANLRDQIESLQNSHLGFDHSDVG
jgi:excinuclease ABC subunit B